MSDIKGLKKNITESISKMKRLSAKFPSENGSHAITNLHTKEMFEDYASKLLQYGNITDEVEWNELTANEFVTSIQTTIGNIYLTILCQDINQYKRYLMKIMSSCFLTF